ncbi:N-fatty-acyl-amino acid synthase/hydrolase PM20D1-like [Dermacentor andersoni]|uniref:N-fatty-acyl-amino acid synthase/hydrolase PM20D1-like n=1 Tax=Dermacentor andersoni TaxID=34620 RepID=UPI002415D4B5|nr:N-fatty-acyl-amino acid synthase/hydrolase PM20D1-like isoform X1 [Dermacentor andersoni]
MFTLVAASTLSLLIAVVVRAILIKAPDVPCTWPDGEQELAIKDNERHLSERLAAALRFPTVSTGLHEYNREALVDFVQFLEKAFPRVHSSHLVKRHVVANYSLLYEIQGSDPKLVPYMLCAHTDVVPADATKWHHPPFVGQVLDGEIWGRGAIDAKGILMGIMEALEFRLEQGDLPRRGLFLAFGHDEEVQGLDGAAAISRVLRAKGVKQVEFILDEGMLILERLLPGLQRPVAMVAVTEKGSILARVSARGTSGHSAAPPVNNAIVTLSKALSGFHGRCQPAQLSRSMVAEMFTALAPEVPFHLRLALANMWLLGPAISWFMSRNQQLDSMIRTTTTVTRIAGGVKDNVVPAEAHAYINHRVHPSQSVAEVIELDRQLLGGLPNVSLEVLHAMEAHPVSPHSEQELGFRAIACSVRKIFPEAISVPALALGNTDTRYYLDLTRNVYRFAPVLLTPQEASSRLHGDNERISRLNYERLVNFYRLIMRYADHAGISHQSRDEL